MKQKELEKKQKNKTVEMPFLDEIQNFLAKNREKFPNVGVD